MYLPRVISFSAYMIAYDLFEPATIQVRSRERPRVEEHVLYVFRQLVTIPDAEVVELVPPKKQFLEMKRSQTVIDCSDPLWHAVIVGVLRLKSKLPVKVATLRNSRHWSVEEATVCGDLGQITISICNQAYGRLIAKK